LTQVLSDMAEGNISSEMLQKTKTNLMGGFALRMDSNSERAGLLSMMGMYQRPLDYLQHWTQSIESVTLPTCKGLPSATCIHKAGSGYGLVLWLQSKSM
ncbi:MAG: hypothetical protein R8M45_11095, partial [Ghiorsea sp.]